MTRPNKTETKAVSKYLTLELADEVYGIHVLSVHEIVQMLQVTTVPRTPDYVCGVVNLRGKIIPVLDLRLKLNMPKAATTEETCIIVVQMQGIEMGVIVDRVREVVDIADDDIQPPPTFGSDVNTDYLLGLGNSETGVQLLLDIDRVLSRSEAASIARTMGRKSVTSIVPPPL